MGSEVKGILIDYKKVFDLIDHNIFMSKLKNYGINPFRIISLVNNGFQAF